MVTRIASSLAIPLLLQLAIATTAAAQSEAAPVESHPQAATTAEPDTTSSGSDLERLQAEAEGGPEAGGTSEEVDPGYSHQEQLGLRVGAGVPYVFAVKYGRGPECDDPPGETFCRRFGAVMLDLDLSFGVSPTVEITALVRLGLTEDRAASARPLAFGLGVRGYGSPDAPVKMYFSGRIMLDVTSSDTPEWSTVDVGGRGELGVQFDFLRQLGAYIQLGESLSFLRGLYFVTDFTAGLQGRIP